MYFGAEYPLFDYVVGNPDSYVALWSLIERFSLFGHSTLRATMLNKFSDDIKSTKLWTILNYDVINSKIKEDHKFPLIIGKTLQLEEQKITFPKAQYILIDFWFSRCIPCLEVFPFLKELYANYRSKGFEIISISTDKTKELPLWKKRINEYELPWAQYWDENGTEAKSLAIHRFPSTFLLDSEGNLIRKYISLQDLELFLKMHLGKE